MRKDPINQEPERHESYGMVSFSRVTCSPTQALFGSSIRHGNIIALRIAKGRKYRSYQNDRYMADGNFIEVFMSPTQFAEAITSFNVGDGVPCTVHKVIGDKWDEDNRKYREPCPEVNFRKQATEELKEEMEDLGSKVAELSKNTEEILNTKGTIKAGDKKTLLANLRNVVQEIKSNIPFVNECFNRSVNKAVTEARGEIDATYQSMRERLGDKAIEAGKVELPMLEEVNETPED